jgi:hypothetical protein
MVVVGIQEKQGEYNGIKYHNYMLHCLKDDDNALGQVSEVLKVKVANFKEIFGCPFSIDYLNSIIGCEIRAHYDRNGNVSEIIVSSESSDKSDVKK